MRVVPLPSVKIMQQVLHDPRLITGHNLIITKNFIFLFTVIVQDLEVRLYEEFVVEGNTAVMRCVIPALSKDFVTVTSWERDSSIQIYPSLHGG